jgi:integrase
MALELRRGRDGKLRNHWYGRVVVDGRSKVVNLGVAVKGTPPASLLNKGDVKFELSRKAAEKELERVKSEADQKGHAQHLTERLIEMKTGKAVEHVRIDEIAARWLGLPRPEKLSPAYESGVKSACEQFRAFMEDRRPAAVRLYEVTSADAGAFAEKLRKECAPMTANAYCGMIRRACHRFLPSGHMNPFAAVLGRSRSERGGGSVHRVPFTPEELAAVLETARGFEGGGLHGPVVAAACTALRRGDACRLAWESVDFEGGAVTVTTSKTGETVDLPLLAPLREVLEALPGPRVGFCFPVAARMLAENPDGLTWRFKAIIAAALGGEKPGDAARDREALEAAGLAAIGKLPQGERRKHMAEAFRRYMEGGSVPGIAREMGVSKGSVSEWLSAVAGMTGMPVIRSSKSSVRAGIALHTQATRERGHRAASVRDWHALRTTFVTLALAGLNSNAPMPRLPM